MMVSECYFVVSTPLTTPSFPFLFFLTFSQHFHPLLALCLPLSPPLSRSSSLLPFLTLHSSLSSLGLLSIHSRLLNPLGRDSEDFPTDAMVENLMRSTETILAQTDKMPFQVLFCVLRVCMCVSVCGKLMNVRMVNEKSTKAVHLIETYYGLLFFLLFLWFFLAYFFAQVGDNNAQQVEYESDYDEDDNTTANSTVAKETTPLIPTLKRVN